MQARPTATDPSLKPALRRADHHPAHMPGDLKSAMVSRTPMGFAERHDARSVQRRSVMHRTRQGAAVLLLLAMSVAPINAQQLPPGYGEQPKLPTPEERWLPILKWSVANEPWAQGQTPKPAPGLRVAAFARRLKHPRWLH